VHYYLDVARVHYYLDVARVHYCLDVARRKGGRNEIIGVENRTFIALVKENNGVDCQKKI